MPDLTPENNAPMPRSGGFAPTPDEALSDYHKQQRWAENARYAKVTDARVNMMTAAQAMWLHGGNRDAATKWMGSDAGRLSREAWGSAASYGMLGHGSPVALMSGISQMNSASQFRVNAFGGAAQMYGGGAVSDMMSRRIFDDVKKSMFSSVTGVADLRKTQGFNQSQMGEIFKVMGEKRMFSGMTAGSMSIDDKTGGISFLTNDQTMGRIKKMFADTSKLLANVRDLVGDKSMTQLAADAEKLSGLSLSGSHSPAAMNSRIDQLRQSAKIMGVDQGSLLTAHRATMQMVAPMVGNNMAASMSVAAWRGAGVAHMDRAAQVASARARGEHLGSWDQEEIAQIGMAGQMRLLKENPFLVEAAYVLENSSGSAEDKDSLRAAMQGMGSVSNPAERIKAIERLQAATEKVSGARAGTYVSMLGTKNIMDKTLSAGTTDLLTGALSAMDQSMNSNLFGDLAGKMGSVNKFFGGKGTAGEIGGLANTFFRGFGSATQDELFAALQGGDSSKFTSLIEGKRGMLESNGMKGSDIDALIKRGAENPTNLASFLKDTQRAMGGIAGFANMESIETRKQATEKLVTDHLFANMIGDVGDRSKVGMVEGFGRALLGGKKVDNPMIMQFLASQDKGGTEQMQFKNNTVQSAGDAQRMASVLNSYGDFNKAMGVSDDPTGEKMFAAMQSDDGKMKFAKYLKDNDVGFANDQKGNFVFANKNKMEAGRKALDATGRAFERAVLNGLDTKDPKVMQRLMDEITADDKALAAIDPSKPIAAASQRSRITEKDRKAFEKGLRGDFGTKALKAGSQESDVLLSMFKANPQDVQMGLAARRAELQGKKGMRDDVKAAKLKELDDLERKLKGSTQDVPTQQLAELQKMNQSLERIATAQA